MRFRDGSVELQGGNERICRSGLRIQQTRWRGENAMSTSQEPESPKKRSRQKRSPVRAGGDRAKLVEKAIQSIEGKLGSQNVKATFSDFIRLLQLQKELQIDQPREIKVSWIESSETESTSEE
jgi:hypothetical protein